MCKPKLTYISTKEMTHEDWLKARKNGIGGSDAGAICGLNPYRSAIAVYQDKISNDIEDFDNESMRIGRDLEGYVAERFMEATGKKVRCKNAIIINEERPFMYANVDRMVVGENAGLECKTASAYSADKWADGNIPESYQIQCHHYMAVTGADAWYIACVILGKGFVYYKIERDEEIINNLIEIEKKFWYENVIPRVMPDPDGSKASDELIEKYFGKATEEKSITLTGFDDELNRRNELDELINKLSKEKKSIEQKIKLFMEDAESAISDNYRVTWKGVLTSRLDSKSLKAEHPDIYEQYTKSIPTRRFLVKAVQAFYILGGGGYIAIPQLFVQEEKYNGYKK